MDVTKPRPGRPAKHQSGFKCNPGELEIYRSHLNKWKSQCPLRAWLQKNGLTMSEGAVTLGISYQTIGKWIYGYGFPQGGNVRFWNDPEKKVVVKPWNDTIGRITGISYETMWIWFQRKPIPPVRRA